ncbi:MAG: response regulator [Kordiimonadaceae bacterium]|nr:response regulator [Kordiimonadaceae bacterium]
MIRGKVARPGDFSRWYNGKTTSLPDRWSGSTKQLHGSHDLPSGFGVVSYRLTLEIPENAPQLSLAIDEIYSAYEVWINGELVVSMGRISATPLNAEALYIPSIVVLPQHRKLDIVLIVSNFEHSRGGVSYGLSIAPRQTFDNRQKKRQLYFMTLFGILGGLLLFHLAYFISSFEVGLASGHRGTALRRGHFWYALTIVLFVTRLALLHEMPFEIGGSAYYANLKSFEFLVVYLMAPVWLAFFAAMFPEEFSRKIQIMLYLPSVPFVFSAIFLPVHITTALLPYFLILALFLVIYQLVLSIKAWRNQRPGAIPIVTTTMVYLISVLHDSFIHVVSFSNFDFLPTDLMPIGFIVISIGYSIALSKKSTFVYRHSIQLAQRLTTLNETLEEKVSLRTYEANAARLEAEKSTAEKTNFLSATSHDLRQPINALSIYNRTLMEKAAGIEPLLNIATQQRTIIGSMMKMLETLLDASRLEANLQTATMTETPLGTIFQSLNDTLEPIARKNNVTLVIVPCSLFIVADVKHLHRILSNLIINAINASPAGKVVLGARRAGRFVNIMVADNGRGIASEDQKRIFDRFVRLTEGGDGPSGFGLGLPIVTDLCVLMDMELGLKSSTGMGTTFKIRAVRTQRPVAIASSTQAKPDPLAVTKRLVILVVDDNKEVKEAMVELLRGWGHSARGLGSLRAVKETLEDFGRPDLIFTDFRLDTHSTGFDVIAAVHKHHPGVPAAIITGATSPDDLRTLAQSSWPIFHKPLDPAQIRKFLAGKLD